MQRELEDIEEIHKWILEKIERVKAGLEVLVLEMSIPLEVDD